MDSYRRHNCVCLISFLHFIKSLSSSLCGVPTQRQWRGAETLVLERQNTEVFLASEILCQPSVPLFFALLFNEVA